MDVQLSCNCEGPASAVSPWMAISAGVHSGGQDTVVSADRSVVVGRRLLPFARLEQLGARPDVSLPPEGDR